MRDDWDIKKLGEVSSIQRGLTFSKNDTVDFSNNIVLRATNISLEKGNLTFTELKYLRADFPVKDIYKLKRGSILICFSSGSKSHLGKVALIDNDYKMSFGGFIGQITPLDTILSKFLYYNLISEDYRNYIQGLTDGININNLKTKDLQEFEFPIPPLAEQKEVLEILDQAFESIDKAKANIEKNIQNAKELFQSKLNQIFSQTAEGWEHIKLKEVCKTGAGGTPLKSKVNYYLNGDIPWIRSGEVNNRNIIDSEIKITKAGLENSSAKLFPPKTVVIAMYGATAGEVGILNFECSSNQAVCGIYPNNTFVPEFLYYKFLDFKENLKSQAVGGAQPNISQQKIKEVLVPTPSFKIQKEIVETLDILDNHIQSLLTSYEEELKNLEELKKSILQKAFSGELTNKNKAA